MIIGEKNTDLKNFAYWQKLGDFIETKAKKLLTSPDLVSPGCARHIFPAIVWFDFEY
jgi:hypothetical protein